MGFVVVTHPFHPLNGRRLEVLFVKRRGADQVFVCVGGVGARATTTLPRAWTDRGDPPVSCWLSIEGLAALAEVTRAIEGC